MLILRSYRGNAIFLTITDIRKRMVKLSERRVADPGGREKLGNAVTDGLLKYHQSGKNIQKLVSRGPKVNRGSGDIER